ncbi:hypothetical protein HK405_013193 [Cladochytrium tenue]|nr:hypothetical protein HK405_013193 [Cladochytrium tenue]
MITAVLVTLPPPPAPASAPHVVGQAPAAAPTANDVLDAVRPLLSAGDPLSDVTRLVGRFIARARGQTVEDLRKQLADLQSELAPIRLRKAELVIALDLKMLDRAAAQERISHKVDQCRNLAICLERFFVPPTSTEDHDSVASLAVALQTDLAEVVIL